MTWCGAVLTDRQGTIAKPKRRRRQRPAKITPESVTKQSPFKDVREAVRLYDERLGDADEANWWNEMPKELFFAVLHYYDDFKKHGPV